MATKDMLVGYLTVLLALQIFLRYRSNGTPEPIEHSNNGTNNQEEPRCGELYHSR
jgi:hypothetical protein